MKKNNIKILLFILVISISLFLISFFKVETDYFWHISAGKYMVNNGILKSDIFSWLLSGKYWMSHEWLFEVILFMFKKIFGNFHTILYCFICIVSLLFIIYHYNKNNFIKNIPYTLLYFTLFIIIFISYIQARPHMISFSFIALTTFILYDLYKNKDSKKIYLLPVITVVWSNIHGGSSNLSYILCFIFLVVGLFSFKFKKMESNRLSKTQLYKYILVMFLCMIGVCINIHGVKMFIYPYENMLDTTMINNISEWQSTSLSNLYHYFYYLFILFIVFTMLISDKKIRFIDLVLLLFATYLGLKSIRFWIYSPIIVSSFIFDYVKDRKIDYGTRGVLCILTVFLFSFFLINFNNTINVKYRINLSDNMVKTIKKESPKRLFNMYDYGGELIYNDIKVFIDGRADLYTKYNYKDYLNISSLNKDYVRLIDKYNFDYLLVSSKYPINTYLKYNDQYELLLKDKNVLLYKKIVN